MTVWRGGRGVKAPYETTHIRIPLPIKDQVQALADRYRETTVLDSADPQLETAIALAKKILTQKRSARVSMEKLLTSLYGQRVELGE
jgi:hypothetical protein